MRIRLLVLLFGALTSWAQCAAATDAPVAPVGSSDYRLLKMEKELSGFGGMFLDDNSALNVYMLRPEIEAPAIETSLRTSTFVTRQVALPQQELFAELTAAPQLAHATDVSITTPKPGAIVQALNAVTGNVRPPKAVWVIVHPIGDHLYWVQPQTSVTENGHWRGLAYFGTSSSSYRGRSFQVMSVKVVEIRV